MLHGVNFFPFFLLFSVSVPLFVSVCLSVSLRFESTSPSKSGVDLKVLVTWNSYFGV